MKKTEKILFVCLAVPVLLLVIASAATAQYLDDAAPLKPATWAEGETIGYSDYPNYNPSLLVDGNFSTYWDVPRNLNPYFILDLQRPRVIREFIFFPDQGDDSSSRLANLRDFTVQVSNDPTFSSYYITACSVGSDVLTSNELFRKITSDLHDAYRYIRLIPTASEAANFSMGEMMVNCADANVALFKPASASSSPGQYGEAVLPSFVNDGVIANVNGYTGHWRANWEDGSRYICIDLMAEYDIYGIEVYRSTVSDDYYEPNKLEYYRISGGNSPDINYSQELAVNSTLHPYPGSSRYYPVSGVNCRYIFLQIQGPEWTWGPCIGEIKVFSNDTPYKANIALGKSASAQSTFTGFESASITDGDLSTIWAWGWGGSYGWCQVDLGEAYDIFGVNAYSRCDVNQPGTRARYEILLSNDPNFATSVSLNSRTAYPGSVTIALPFGSYFGGYLQSDEKYRYVRVQVASPEYGGDIQIAELQVFTKDDVGSYNINSFGFSTSSLTGDTAAASASVANYTVADGLPVCLINALYKDGALQNVIIDSATLGENKAKGLYAPLGLPNDMTDGVYEAKAFLFDSISGLRPYTEDKSIAE